MMSTALATARSAQADLSARSAAVKLLAYDDFTSARPALAALLTATEHQPLQIAAVKALSTFAHAEVAKTLVIALRLVEDAEDATAIRLDRLALRSSGRRGVKEDKVCLFFF